MSKTVTIILMPGASINLTKISLVSYEQKQAAVVITNIHGIKKTEKGSKAG